MKITALTILAGSRDFLIANSDANDLTTAAANKAYDDLVNLISWSEHALDCISASKYPNTHAELRAAIASVKGGAA